ncbi:DUF4272 domain-containing protein [Thermodesulfobacteriota bacterium]
MIKTKEWAESLAINTEDILPPAEDFNEQYKRTAEEVAVRTIILHAVAAAGDGLDRTALVKWLEEQNLWANASPREQTFLLSQKLFREDLSGALWVLEAQWAFLWTIQKTESLGLPNKTCDTHRIINEIMPVPGDETEAFITSAELRNAPELRAEEERTDKLYYAYQNGEEADLPEDLIFPVLLQRQYAFNWLSCEDDWDNVKTE